MEKESFILNDAFVMSIDQMREIKNSHPSFAVRVLSEEAEEQGAYCSSEGNGFSVSCTAGTISSGVRYIDTDSTQNLFNIIRNGDGCSWVGFFHIYDPQMNFVKSAEKTEYSAYGWMPYDEKADKFKHKKDCGRKKEITSKGMVSIFGGKRYLIVNYKEAEEAFKKDGTKMALLCAEVGSSARTVPYSRVGDINFANSTELCEQYHELLTANATEEEMRGVIPVEYVCEMIDGTPCYKPIPRIDLMKYYAKIVAVPMLFRDVFNGKLTVDGLKSELVDLIHKTKNKEGATKADIDELREEIELQSELLVQKMEERARQKAIAQEEARKKQLDEAEADAIEYVNYMDFEEVEK